jgi:acyl-CoA reductase-like NAD-dependent aldehyde dehydrogenase
MTPDARTRALLKIADSIENHTAELGALESLDIGMPLRHSTIAVKKCADVFRYYAGWPSKIIGTTNPSDPFAFIYTIREPVGVCALIDVWDMPLTTACMKIANALACGNTAVVKPAELASLTALRLGELIQETDLPPGVVNIVPGPGCPAGAALAGHPRVDKLAFTGSTAMGNQILLASTINLKKVTLELAAKSQSIIFSEADVATAVRSAVERICGSSRQSSAAGTRIFVHESMHDEAANRIAELAATYKVGSPFAEDTNLGPLISQERPDRLIFYVDDGKTEGASLLLGGSRVGDVGHFIEPTVFNAVSNNMKMVREEIIGPVVLIIPFKDEREAISKANDAPHSVDAAVWTRDLTRAHNVSRALRADRVWVNRYGESEPALTPGGYKRSDLGRELSAESVESYTRTKSVHVRFSRNLDRHHLCVDDHGPSRLSMNIQDF